MQEDLFRRVTADYGISPLPENPVVAMAYVPYQSNMGTLYSLEKGLNSGTVFPVLDKPFMGCGGMQR